MMTLYQRSFANICNRSFLAHQNIDKRSAPYIVEFNGLRNKDVQFRRDVLKWKAHPYSMRAKLIKGINRVPWVRDAEEKL